MIRINFLPQWFIVYGLSLEMVYFLVTFVVALYAYKIYKASSQNELKLFSIGFFSISLSYLLWFAMNLFAFFELNEDRLRVVDLLTANKLLNIGAYLHIFLFLIGLIFLCYVTLKIKNKRALFLISALIGVAMFLSTSKVALYYYLSAALIFFIGVHYYYEYQEKRNPRVALMLGAFALLFVGKISLALGSFREFEHILGHMFIFLSYLLILINLIGVFKHGQKKNKT